MMQEHNSYFFVVTTQYNKHQLHFTSDSLGSHCGRMFRFTELDFVRELLFLVHRLQSFNLFIDFANDLSVVWPKIVDLLRWSTYIWNKIKKIHASTELVNQYIIHHRMENTKKKKNYAIPNVMRSVFTTTQAYSARI